MLTSNSLFDNFCVTLKMSKMLCSLGMKLIYHILQYMNKFEQRKVNTSRDLHV